MAEQEKHDAPKADEPKTKRPRKRRRWLRRGLITLALLAIAYTLFGFFGVPALIKGVGISRISDRLRGEASLERAAFNPFTLALTLEGFGIDNESGQRVAGFERFEGDFELLATVFQPGFRFDRAIVTAPMGLAAIDRNGRVNLLDIVEPSPAPAEPGEPLETIPRIVIRELAVLGASATFRDETPSEPFEKQLADLNFTINDLDTDPEHENAFQIVAALEDGTAVEWNGTFFVNPLTASGSLTMTGLDLSSFMPYAGELTTLDLSSGRMSMEVSYEIAPVRETDRAALTVASVVLEDVEVAEAGGERVLSAPRVALRDIDADADGRRLSIGEVRVEGGVASVVREENGELRAMRFGREAEAAQRAARDREQERASRVDVQAIEYPLVQLATAVRQLVMDLQNEWEIDIEKIALDDSGASFEDRSTPSPVLARIESVSLEAGPVRSSEQFRTPFTVAATINGAPIAASGEVRPLEIAAEVDVEGDGLALAPFAPYLPTEFPEPAPAARLAGGEAGFNGRATFAMRDGEALEATWEGAVGLDALEAQSPEGGATLLSVRSFGLDGAANLRLLESGPALEWNGATTVADARVDADIGQRLMASAQSASVQSSLRLGGDTEGLRFTGDVEAGGYSLDAPDLDDLQISGESARLGGIDFDQAGATLAVDQVSAQAPRIRRRMTLTPVEQVAEEAAEPGGAPGVRGVTGLPLQVRVGQVGVRAGHLEIVDSTISEEPAVVVDEIEIDLANIVSDGATPTDVNFRAVVQSSGGVEVTGQADAFRELPFADLVVRVQGVPMRPYSPLAAPRLGFEIDRGRVTVEVPVRAEEGHVEGRLDVLLDAFYLGERVEAPQAPDVPMKLGLNLLRNRNDQIKVNVPFSGEMTDPSFTLGGVITNAFFDLLGRAATAPFQLLANAIGGGADLDLSQVAFEPGSADLSADALSVVDALGRALYERPALSLVATGVYDPAADAEALRRAALDASLLARAQEDDPGVMGLDDARYLAQLEALFAERFPARAPVRVPVPPGARDQVDVPAEEMESALLAQFEVTDEQLAALARERAEACVEVIVADAGVESGRLRLGEPRAVQEDESAKVAFEIRGE